MLLVFYLIDGTLPIATPYAILGGASIVTVKSIRSLLPVTSSNGFQRILFRVELKFVVAKHPCLIHPEDRIDEDQCVQWTATVPGMYNQYKKC